MNSKKQMIEINGLNKRKKLIEHHCKIAQFPPKTYNIIIRLTKVNEWIHMHDIISDQIKDHIKNYVNKKIYSCIFYQKFKQVWNI